MKTLSVIGAGKVGKVLSKVWREHGVFQTGQILNRSAVSAAQAVSFIGAGEALSDVRQLQAADVWMLSVADDQIATAAQLLLASGVLRRGDLVFHCSGAKASTELQALHAAGVVIASLHPVRSFADVAQSFRSFGGTICSIEGDAAALAILDAALTAVQAQAVRIHADAKLVYHAASVMASNYLVSLMDVALQAYQAAGIPHETAKVMAAPLARQSLENAFALGTERALTGPIARGDMQLVEQQAAAVAQWDAIAGDLYRSFVPPTLALAARQHHSEK